MLGLTGGLRDCVRRFAGRSVRDHEGKAGGGSSSVFPAPESEARTGRVQGEGAGTGASAAGRLVLRGAVPADLEATARIHVRLLPVGFFPALGVRFVRRWHRTFLESPHAVAFVAVEPNAPGDNVGAFLFGSTDEAAHMSALWAERRSVAALTFLAAVSLLGRPGLIRRFVRTRARPWTRRLVRTISTRSTMQPHNDAPVAVLSAVAVEPVFQGSGVGVRLVALFLERADARGAAAAELVTLTGPGGADRFYERLGWSAVGVHTTRDGHTVRSYRYLLASQPGSPARSIGRADGSP